MNRSGNTGKYSSSSLETEKAGFLFHRKVRPMKQKTLREDRTAAEWNYVADATPPQAENLASEILSCFTEELHCSEPYSLRTGGKKIG